MKLQHRIPLEIFFITVSVLAFDLLVRNYLFFHVIVEMFSIIIMFVLFSITWNARNILNNGYLLFVGSAAGFIGVLDLLHTITYTGMNIIPSPVFYANQFWVATRFFESLVLLSGFIFVSNKYRVNIKNLLILYTAVTISIILSILYFEIFPISYIEGVGQTPFKIYSEFVIILILIAAFIVLRRNRKYFEKETYILIATSIILTITSEFCFTLYFSNYDYINKIGHAFKVLAFYMIYKANIESGFNRPIETFFRDLKISEEKNREYNRELEKQIATKNKFFSVISHDLKNPFTVLVGFTELLLQNHTRYTHEEREKVIRTIFSSAERTLKLLENLLSWARTQTNTIPVKPVRFDIRTVLDESVTLSNARVKSIEIIRDYSSEWVYADTDMVKTIVRNLLSNAIKFTPRSGKITIQTRREGAVVSISIADTGIGIPEEKMKLFFNIDKTFSTKGTENESGTGLGLLLCAEFVAKNKGEIKVESQVGKGSKFTFTLPASENEK